MTTQIGIALAFVSLPSIALAAWWWAKARKGPAGEGVPDALALLRGFSLALLASLCWGVGNVVTSYSATHFAEATSARATLDIAIANYLSGSLTIGCGALVVGIVRRTPVGWRRALNAIRSPRVVLAALCKGANTYAFTASVAMVSASVAALVENLYILWAGVFAAIASRTMPARNWWLSGFVVLFGTALVLKPTIGPASVTVVGLVLALVAGITFALFIALWREPSPSDYHASLANRALMTALFLAMSGIVILGCHYVGGRLLFGGNLGLFTTLSRHHLVIQLINGIVNIGMTYFLVSESLGVLRRSGPTAGFIVCVGLSYAVLFTQAAEVVWSGATLDPVQWIGMGCFTVGIAAARAGGETK